MNNNFGDSLKKVRRQSGLSQSDIAKAVGKNQSTIARYEQGKLSPTLDDIKELSKALNIDSSYLLSNVSILSEIFDLSKSKNPFKTNIVYLYYYAYISRTNSYGYGIFKLKFRKIQDLCVVDFMDKKTNQVYLTGLLIANEDIAFIIFSTPRKSGRTEIALLTINLQDGVDGLLRGSYTGTNKRYIPSGRKCVISTELVDFEKDIAKFLKLTDEDKRAEKYSVVYYDTTKLSAFEENEDE